MSLTSHENALLSSCTFEVDVAEEANVVLIVPCNWQPQWSAESGVTNNTACVRWLDRAYELMRTWTGEDPNHTHATTHERHRLVLVANGTCDFVFGGVPRPFIGLRDGLSPRYGTNGWFGWIAHELSHDFFHAQRYNTGRSIWGEGMCDYSRYHVLSANGMPNAAAEWELSLSVDPPDKYGSSGFLGADV